MYMSLLRSFPSSVLGGNTQSTVTPSVNKRSAVWPSVIFSQSASKTNAGKVQVS